MDEEKVAFTGYRVWDRRGENKGYHAVLNCSVDGAYRRKARALKATNKRDAMSEAAALFNAAASSEVNISLILTLKSIFATAKSLLTLPSIRLQAIAV